jgi:hypothetical protein
LIHYLRENSIYFVNLAKYTSEFEPYPAEEKEKPIILILSHQHIEAKRSLSRLLVFPIMFAY